MWGFMIYYNTNNTQIAVFFGATSILRKPLWWVVRGGAHLLTEWMGGCNPKYCTLLTMSVTLYLPKNQTGEPVLFCYVGCNMNREVLVW